VEILQQIAQGNIAMGDHLGIVAQQIPLRPLSNHNLEELQEMELRPLLLQIVTEMRQDRAIMMDEMRQMKEFIHNAICAQWKPSLENSLENVSDLRAISPVQASLSNSSISG
jgi:hypothetical protein